MRLRALPSTQCMNLLKDDGRLLRCQVIRTVEKAGLSGTNIVETSLFGKLPRDENLSGADLSGAD